MLCVELFNEFGYVYKYVAADIHEVLAWSKFKLVVLMDVFCQPRVDKCDDAIRDVVLKSSADDFISCESLVVVPLDDFASSGRVVDYMCTVELVKASWRHGFWIILYSGQVHKVDSFM